MIGFMLSSFGVVFRCLFGRPLLPAPSAGCFLFCAGVLVLLLFSEPLDFSLTMLNTLLKLNTGYTGGSLLAAGDFRPLVLPFCWPFRPSFAAPFNDGRPALPFLGDFGRDSA